MSPTPEEVAAVTAVSAALEQRRRAAAAAASEAPSDELHMWVEASRRSAQRALLTRGPWRLSGRIGRRTRV